MNEGKAKRLGENMKQGGHVAENMGEYAAYVEEKKVENRLAA